MSKDTVGPVAQVTGVPSEGLDLPAEMVDKLVVGPIEERKVEPTIIDLGQVEVNYDETIVEKLATIIGQKQAKWQTDWVTAYNSPDARTGKRCYRASAVYFGKITLEKDLEQWLTDNNKIRASAMEGVDLTKTLPRAVLDKVTPLAATGRPFVDGAGCRFSLCFTCDGVGGSLDYFWLSPGGRWHGGWWFLVIEEVP